ncbi:MAG: GTP cyclohydrolase I FolE [Methylobacteriaceae bacterium]|nr:GTP cyclohydrolase I FolE [Methylobacteriaceae bacterium]
METFNGPTASAKLPRPEIAEVEEAVRTLIRWLGDDPQREGLLETPKRVAAAFLEYGSGYREDARSVLDKVFTDTGHYGEMVLVRDIPFFSLCEHHLAPFFGHAQVAYLPEGGVVGLSKLARLVEVFARRLQTQEKMTAEIAETLAGSLETRGVAVLVEAEHLCMTMRGVNKPGTRTMTCHFTGVFKDDAALQARFFSLARTGGHHD